MAVSPFKTPGANWLLHDEVDPRLECAPRFEELMHAARRVRENAYAPYSNFQVGAAVLMGDQIYVGCNVENASYGATNCAERSAIFAGVSNGQLIIEALALTTGPKAGTPLDERSPCGICRQVIAEFADAQTPILIDAGQGTDPIGDIVALERLLPFRFKIDP